jgi:hypothetical protein
MTYQRFQDADVQAVGPEVSLEREYGKRGWGWAPWVAAAGVGFLLLAAAAVVLVVLRQARRAQVRPLLPAHLTPFTTLDFLTRVRGSGRLSDDQRRELDSSILEIERHYFANGTNGHPPDLRRIAERWLFATG